MLDEAHFIKDRSTSTAKAVFALTSLYKWCLTGTPLQNRVSDDGDVTFVHELPWLGQPRLLLVVHAFCFTRGSECLQNWSAI